jgi:large subunit ribosomal protein L32e
MELLQLRKVIKAKKPLFARQENTRKKKLDDGKWRRPRGVHSKMRLHIRGKRASPSPGYGSPREVEGLHPSGVRAVVVHTIMDIDELQKNEGAVLGSTLGMRKRALLAEYAAKKGIMVINIKGDFLKEVAEKMSARKEAKKKSKSKVEKVAEKKDEKKEGKAPEPTAREDEQKKKEKEEKDKLLTKRV